MQRLSLATALATTFLLSFSMCSTQAQNLKTTTERTDPESPQQFVYNPQPVLDDDGEPLDWGDQQEIKLAVGFERWLPEAPPYADTIVTGGAGWFYRNNLTQLEINVVYPMMGFRAVDIEVEQWAGQNTIFSAIFVQNTGNFEVYDSYVMIGEEEDIRGYLFGGEWSNYRAIDLEVAYSRGHQIKNEHVTEVRFLPKEIAVLLVPNEGNQHTPEWDFIVHATPIQLAGFVDSFEGSVRVIDNEISIDEYTDFVHDGDNLEDVVYSQIMVSNEGIEHVETAIFQYSTVLELSALEQNGWQLIDSERNVPLMYEDYPEHCGLYTGVFVQKPNSTEFWEELNGYTDVEQTTLEPKRMIDLELVRDGGSFLLDELYLLLD